MFILASSVCWSLQYLTSALTQEGEGGHLPRLTRSIVLRGGRNTASKHPWRVWGARVVSRPHQFAPAHGGCASQVYAAQAPACSAGELSKAPGVACTSQAYAAQVQVLGCCTKAQTRLGLRFVSFPGPAAQGTRSLARSLSPGGGASCPSPAPPAGFGVRSGSAVSGVPWVSSGSWSLRPS